MKKIFTPLIKKITLISSFALCLLFTFISASIKTIPSDSSLLSSIFKLSSLEIHEVAAYVVLFILFLVSIFLTIFGVINAFRKKKNNYSLISFICIFIIGIISLIINNIIKIMATGSIVLIIFNLIFSLIGIIYCILYRILKSDSNGSDDSVTFKSLVKANTGLFITTIISFLSVFVMLFIPFATINSEYMESITIIPIHILFTSNGVFEELLSFVVILIILLINMFNFTSVLNNKKNNDLFIRKCQKNVYLNLILSIVYFIVAIAYAFINNLRGFDISTITYIIPILMAIITIVFSYFYGKNQVSVRSKKKDGTLIYKIELMVFVTLFTTCALLGLLFNIIEVTFSEPIQLETITINGYQLLKDYPNYGEGVELLAFFIIAFILMSSVMFIFSLTSLLSKSKLFKKIALYSIIINITFIFLVGLFGTYYQIVQNMNEELINNIIGNRYPSLSMSYKYTIKSQSTYALYAAIILGIVLISLSPFSKISNKEKSLSNNETIIDGQISNDHTISVKSCFDACPSFTEIDNKLELFKEELTSKRAYSFTNLSLPSLTRFIVDYARDSRLHLFYEFEDIATFIAGLGACKLSILQGMSGTGKTSLPKIFLEAINGNCEIIEVESSWRDKNELLGYYNEFSKTYTPKKFTQALYKASLNQDVMTFIVLDEMNLSRIEYYFSDFLSLMENEEDKREIKLVNIKLFNDYDGVHHSYLGLKEDHTIRIPPNVYFIGTANRDESTFEISDKVYDRAHTMNFNRRAKKMRSYNNPLDKRFVSYNDFIKLINFAKESINFEIENYPLFNEVEQLLIPYNISFGNRIAKQMEDFVKVYCSCFDHPQDVINDAIEKILLSKVVSKLEYKSIENKQELIDEFERLKLYRCSEFISKLNED